MASDSVNVDFHSVGKDEVHASDLEGEIAFPGDSAPATSISASAPDGQEFNTLDEPVKETILRDLKAVGVKFYHVFIPRKSKMLLKEWDLWGPLVLCVFLAMMLQSNNLDIGTGHATGPQFAQVFVITFSGSILVTLNSKLLGGTLSFFQSVCVLGYCLVPLAISLLLSKLILWLVSQSMIWFIFRLVIVVSGCGWALFASTAFLGNSQPPNRKILAMYPIFLYYIVIAWLILSESG